MEYLSLYDYLGHAAGLELGKEVATAAIEAGIRLETREIDNPKYTGIVCLYPKNFLDFYFREPASYQIEDAFPLSDNDILTDDELPF